MWDDFDDNQPDASSPIFALVVCGNINTSAIATTTSTSAASNQGGPHTRVTEGSIESRSSRKLASVSAAMLVILVGYPQAWLLEAKSYKKIQNDRAG